MENINTKKLIEYINDGADQSEKQADKWGADGYFNETFRAQLIADFLRDELVRGIEMDLIDAEK